MKNKIQDFCISVHIRADHLRELQYELIKRLAKGGVEAEVVDSSLHVSIVYGQGETSVDNIERVAGQIQRLETSKKFRACASGFKVLEGLSTPYDYLTVEIEQNDWLTQASQIAEQSVPVRRIKGGFKSHISLLKIKKGGLSSRVIQGLIREVDASIRAACSLGCAPSWSGECVAVTDRSRVLCCRKQLSAA